MYFHDGREMKASDVAATMDAIAAIARDESREDNQKGLYCKLPDMISSWTAEDDYTLTVRTDRPYLWPFVYHDVPGPAGAVHL